jgi:hypothetical protein
LGGNAVVSCDTIGAFPAPCLQAISSVYSATHPLVHPSYPHKVTIYQTRQLYYQIMSEQDYYILVHYQYTHNH